MKYKQYIASTGSFKNLDEKRGMKFYRMKGNGPAINIVSPTQQSVERAKMDIKRQIAEKAPNAGPGINSTVKPKKTQSRSKRGRVKKSKKKSKKKGRPAQKTVSRQEICKTKRKYKRK